jgi:hypothetical protein
LPLASFESLSERPLNRLLQCTVATHHGQSSLAQTHRAKPTVHIDGVIVTGSSLMTLTIKGETSNQLVYETSSNFTTQDPPLKCQFK